MEINLQQWKGCLLRAGQQLLSGLETRPRFRAVLPVLAGLLLVTAVCLFKPARLYLYQAPWYLPVPLFYYLFLRLSDNHRGLYRPASVRAANISTSGFFLALFCSGLPQFICLVAGIVAGMCVFVDAAALRRAARQAPARAAVALTGGFSGVVYFFVQKALWKTLAAMTAKMVYGLMHFFIPKMAVFPRGGRPGFLIRKVIHAAPPPGPNGGAFRVRHGAPRRVFFRAGPGHGKRADLPPPKSKGKVFDNAGDFMAVASDQFTLKIAFFQNISAGIGLFIMLLALELMLSGRPVGKKRMAAIIIGGVAAVVVINALALTLYFAICHAALTPQVSPMMAVLSRKMVLFFSSPLVSFTGYFTLSLLVLRLFMPEMQLLNVVRRRRFAA